MNYSELVKSIAGTTKVSNKDVAAVFESLAAIVESQIKAGGEVALHGVGKIKAHHKAACTARNPKTGAAVAVPAKLTAVFSVSKPLKDSLALQA